MAKKKGKKSKKGKPDMSLVAWESSYDDGPFCAGYIKIKPSFLYDLIEAYEAGYEPIIDEYDPENPVISLRFNLRESDYTEGQFYGSAYMPEEKEE